MKNPVGRSTIDSSGFEELIGKAPEIRLMLGEIIWNERTLAIGLGCCIPLSAIIGTFWYLVQKTKTENDLKRSMVERGMSAEDIERVLAAGPSSGLSTTARPRDRQPQP